MVKDEVGPLVAGEVLTTVQRPGEMWEKESKRGGTLRFEEGFIDYLNAATGELVVTARFVSVLPPQPAQQGTQILRTRQPGIPPF